MTKPCGFLYLSSQSSSILHASPSSTFSSNVKVLRLTLNKRYDANISVLMGKHPYSRAESALKKFFAIFAAAAAASVFSFSYTYVTGKYCMNVVSDPLLSTVVKHLSALRLDLPRPPSENARNSTGAGIFPGIVMKDMLAFVFAFTVCVQH